MIITSIIGISTNITKILSALVKTPTGEILDPGMPIWLVLAGAAVIVLLILLVALFCLNKKK